MSDLFGDALHKHLPVRIDLTAQLLHQKPAEPSQIIVVEAEKQFLDLGLVLVTSLVAWIAVLLYAVEDIAALFMVYSMLYRKVAVLICRR